MTLQAVLRDNAHLAKEILVARQKNAELKEQAKRWVRIRGVDSDGGMTFSQTHPNFSRETGKKAHPGSALNRRCTARKDGGTTSSVRRMFGDSSWTGEEGGEARLLPAHRTQSYGAGMRVDGNAPLDAAPALSL